MSNLRGRLRYKTLPYTPSFDGGKVTQVGFGGTKKGSHNNPWIAHVKRIWASSPGMSYKEALKVAKSSYKTGRTGRVRKRSR